MINVIVVPEVIREDVLIGESDNNDYRHFVSHANIVWINESLGVPDLKGRNAKYLAPYWIIDNESFRGVNRIYHILEMRVDSGAHEIRLGNSFLLKETWDNMGSPRKFEYHSLNEFNFVEITDGLLTHYKFN